MASTSMKNIGTPYSVVSLAEGQFWFLLVLSAISYSAQLIEETLLQVDVYRKCFPCSVQYYLHLGSSLVYLRSLELRLTYVTQVRHT